MLIFNINITRLLNSANKMNINKTSDYIKRYNYRN